MLAVHISMLEENYDFISQNFFQLTYREAVSEGRIDNSSAHYSTGPFKYHSLRVDGTNDDVGYTLEEITEGNIICYGRICNEDNDDFISYRFCMKEGNYYSALCDDDGRLIIKIYRDDDFDAYVQEARNFVEIQQSMMTTTPIQSPNIENIFRAQRIAAGL